MVGNARSTHEQLGTSPCHKMRHSLSLPRVTYICMRQLLNFRYGPSSSFLYSRPIQTPPNLPTVWYEHVVLRCYMLWLSHESWLHLHTSIVDLGSLVEACTSRALPDSIRYLQLYHHLLTNRTRFLEGETPVKVKQKCPIQGWLWQICPSTTPSQREQRCVPVSSNMLCEGHEGRRSSISLYGCTTKSRSKAQNIDNCLARCYPCKTTCRYKNKARIQSLDQSNWIAFMWVPSCTSKDGWTSKWRLYSGDETNRRIESPTKPARILDAWYNGAFNSSSYSAFSPYFGRIEFSLFVFYGIVLLMCELLFPSCIFV